jgi:hypothetical protein
MNDHQFYLYLCAFDGSGDYDELLDLLRTVPRSWRFVDLVLGRFTFMNELIEHVQKPENIIWLHRYVQLLQRIPAGHWFWFVSEASYYTVRELREDRYGDDWDWADYRLRFGDVDFSPYGNALISRIVRFHPELRVYRKDMRAHFAYRDGRELVHRWILRGEALHMDLGPHHSSRDSQHAAILEDHARAAGRFTTGFSRSSVWHRSERLGARRDGRHGLPRGCGSRDRDGGCTAGLLLLERRECYGSH